MEKTIEIDVKFSNEDCSKYIKFLYHVLNSKVSELKAYSVFKKSSLDLNLRNAKMLEEIIDDIDIKTWYDNIVAAETKVN